MTGIDHDRIFPSPTLLKSAVILITLLVLGGIWTFVHSEERTDRDTAIASAVRQNQNRVLSFEQFVLRTLEAAEAAAEYAAERYCSTGNPARPTLIRGAILDDTMFAVVNVIDGEGHVIASTLPSPGRTDVSRHPMFAKARANPQPLQVSPPARTSMVPGTHIILNRRYDNPDGSLACLAGVLIKPQELIAFARDARFSHDDLISIIGLDGITRARREGDVVSWGQNLSGTLVMRMQQRHPNGTYLGPSARDGRVRYFSHRRLLRYSLFVTSGVSPREILAPVILRARILHFSAAAATLASLAIAVLLILIINRRQRIIDEMRAANERLLEAQRVGQMGDWEYDPVKDLIHWSLSMCEMYERGYDESYSSLEEIARYVGPGTEGQIRQTLMEVFETGVRQEYEIDVILPSRTRAVHRIAAVPTIGRNGRITGVHGTDQNISERRKLREAEEALAHVARVDAMNAMASTLAHELNQPLTAATNYLSGTKRLLDREGVAGDSKIAEAIELAATQVRYAGKVISRARSLLKPDEARDEQASLAGIVADALRLIKGAHAAGKASIKVKLDPVHDRVRADPVQIQQVVVNLLRNAGDAVTRVERPKVTISSRTGDAGEVIVSVADNGPGMPDDIGDPFSAFSTTKREGLGLGLSISRTIIEANGGKIWVETSDATGTTIRFSLPQAPDPALPS